MIPKLNVPRLGYLLQVDGSCLICLSSYKGVDACREPGTALLPLAVGELQSGSCSTCRKGNQMTAESSVLLKRQDTKQVRIQFFLFHRAAFQVIDAVPFF